MPTKVAILGGGMGALAAAWKLTDPQASGTYEVTVYQRDGLLGGKGASSRNAKVGMGDRIEEHGIHVLMGFYDNTLKLLEECYAELAQNGQTGVLPWNDVLTPWDEVTLTARTAAGWDHQNVPFPTNNLPFGGDGTPAYVPAMFANAIGWFVFFLSKLGVSVPLPIVSALKSIIVCIVKLLVFLGSLGLPVSGLFGIVRWWLDLVVARTWDVVAPMVASNRQVRWLWVALWFAGTNLRGMIDEGILSDPHDFSVMNGQDYKDWLQSQSVVSPPPEFSTESPPVQAVYDIAFSYGHPIEAGVVLYNLLLIALSYKQHFAYRMNAGMGEAVFLPLYRALDHRGVKFAFYNTVTSVSGDFDGGGELKVDTIRLSIEGPQPLAPNDLLTQQQVQLNNNALSQLDTWKGQPVAGVSPPAIKELSKGTDFDVVVLGISVGALGGICADLAAKDVGFNQMLALQTLQTQSAQLWLDESLAQLGWAGGPNPGMVSFARPFNSWLDMTHLIPKEGWGPAPPKTIVYFSDEYVPDNMGGEPNAVVRDRLINLVNNELPGIWPGLTLDALKAPTGVLGDDRVLHQYWRANTDPSDRYVICGVGTNDLRLAADGSTFRNLALAGDWVRTHLNTGCLEAATTAGFAAAQAIEDGVVHS